MTEDTTTNEAPSKQKAYDLWSIWSAVIALVCIAWSKGLEGSMTNSALLRHGPPLGGMDAPRNMLMFLMLTLRVTAVTAFITGLAGLFIFRKSRWLALVGLLISVPLVFLFVVMAIVTAMS